MADKTVNTIDDSHFRLREVVPAIGKFSTRNAGFLDLLNEAKGLIETYISRENTKRPLNVLLAAPPGNGKSFLIKQLIKSIQNKKLQFEEVYVASFSSPEDLAGVFQRIQSINLSGKIPVMFFDEVDAKVGDEHLYKYFLSPMWDGAFFIGKDQYHLGKSIFFFAGSTLSLEEDSQKILSDAGASGSTLKYSEYMSKWLNCFDDFVSKGEIEKILDFVDRIDSTIRIPPLHNVLLDGNYDDEIIDLVVLLITKHHPTVQYVGQIALDHLTQMLKESTSLRPLDKLIFASSSGAHANFDVFSFPPSVRNRITVPKDVEKKGFEQSGLRLPEKES